MLHSLKLISDRKLGRGPPQHSSWAAPGGYTQINKWNYVACFLFESRSVLSRKASCRCWGLTFHCGALEERLLLPFRFHPVQDPVVAHWNLSFMTFNIFFKFISPIWDLPSYQAWVLAVKNFLSEPKIRAFFYLWPQWTVVPPPQVLQNNFF